MDFNTSSNKKNGLIYKDDFKTVTGIDPESDLFTGRVPFGAHKITAEAFSNTTIENFNLPDSITELGDCLFENSTAVTKVKLPYALKKLPAYLFSGCSSLESVTMPNEIDALSEGIFYGCSSLKEPVFRPGINSIPANAFCGCSSIRSVIIPEYVNVIESKAFALCTGITSVIIPSNIMDISPDAFEGCSNITSVRLNGESAIFFINKEDGCLYERTANGDELIIKVSAVEKQTVDFFMENEEDLPEEGFFENEEINEEDETFSSEVQADEAEMISITNEMSNPDEVQMSFEEEQSIISDMPENNLMENAMEPMMNNPVENNVDSMLADIMNDERARTEVVSDSVAVGEKESQILSEMMDVMNDKADAPDNGAKVSEDELARLFSSNESSEPTGDNPEVEQAQGGIDPKLQILLNSVKTSSIIDCEPAGEAPSDADLFVIAEKTVTAADGSAAFSNKLVKCVKTFAHIQDLKRIILLSGLPVDNDEFIQFYHHFIAQRNVVFATCAANPANLTAEAKKICEESRISLSKDELISQRKKISIKNNTLIKLVIQDKYED